MATNLQIGYFDYSAITGIAQTTAANGYTHKNLLGGARYKHYRTSAAVTSSTVDFDYGSGNTAQPDFLAISRADLIIREDSADSTFSLIGDSDSGFATTPETESDTIGLSDLMGIDGEDFFLTTSFGTAWRYFRVQVGTTASFQHEYSKAFFGNWFDLGSDPIYGLSASLINSGNWQRRPQLEFNLRWENISDATKASFNDSILVNADANPVFLYDPNDYVFLGWKTVFAMIDSATWTPTSPDQWDLSISFSELI